ncbi:hypothetical protein NM208_g337 [Fusarium decemcellulare]|uniref:Uncharacterized protein n=1 Tax=Fusarium decemcellulare TaxID=57161 RepID=A0ACC1SZP2_9HYPO|nr:hypothetical protein NM208_g337 [Fusarium decemcellulare]
MISAADVSEHSSRASCWVIISGNAYDVTDFIDQHPGGARAILRVAGKDATQEYEPFHAPGTIETHLPKEKHLGPVTLLPSSTTDPIGHPLQRSISPGAPSRISPLPLSACRSLEDLEQAGQSLLSATGRSYFDSGAETLSTLRHNRHDWGRMTFRPRVLRNVTKASMRCRIMGAESSMPVFVAPTAAARLGHKDGELCLAKGAARMAIPQCVSTYASVAPKDIMASFNNDSECRGGALFFQLYVPKKKEDAKKLISLAKSCGYKALVITVDSAVIGKRDDDDRFKAMLDLENSDADAPPQVPGMEGGVVRGVHSSELEWNDLPWIRKCWGDQPIILKGIQTAEDALEASRCGVEGIYLSNHGGRQLDYAPSSVRVLLDIRNRCPEVFDRLEVYVDGGVMRGSDVVKALCLGARAVGIGRGFLYAMSAYGDKGLLKAIQILSDEIQTTMRLLGVTEVSKLDGTYLDLRDLDWPRTRWQASAKI